MTDIEDEPVMPSHWSVFYVYSNQFDVERVIVTSSIYQPKRVAFERIRRIVEAYDKVRLNLLPYEMATPKQPIF